MGNITKFKHMQPKITFCSRRVMSMLAVCTNFSINYGNTEITKTREGERSLTLPSQH